MKISEKYPGVGWGGVGWSEQLTVVVKWVVRDPLLENM